MTNPQSTIDENKKNNYEGYKKMLKYLSKDEFKDGFFIAYKDKTKNCYCELCDVYLVIGCPNDLRKHERGQKHVKNFKNFKNINIKCTNFPENSVPNYANILNKITNNIHPKYQTNKSFIKKVKCPVCELSFPSKSHLKIHFRSHTKGIYSCIFTFKSIYIFIFCSLYIYLVCCILYIYFLCIYRKTI